MHLVKPYKFILIIIVYLIISIFACEKSLKEKELEFKKKQILHKQLFLSIKRGDIENVKELVGHGADLNMKSKKDLISPLQFAYKQKRITIARYLISEDANVRAKSDNLRTALHEAVETANPKDIDLLLSSGADINAQTLDGDSPLLLALYRKKFDNAQELIENGAKLDLKNYKGISALYYSSGKGFLKMVTLLIRYGADLDISTQSGTRPLHISVSNGFYKIVKELIEAGANINILNNYGKRPLDYVKDNKKIKQLLIEHGAINSPKY